MSPEIVFMQENPEDAEFKYSKLLEMAEDIENNTNNLDETTRQLIVKGINSSNNALLFDKFEETLFNDSSSELMKTFAVGFLAQKAYWHSLLNYAGKMIEISPFVNEIHKDRQSLLLVADALIDMIKDENYEDEQLIPTLKAYYKAACSDKSTEPLADMLLQRMMNTLPLQNETVNQMLNSLVFDKNEELNARIISIDILVRRRVEAFWPHFEKFVINLPDFVSTAREQFFMYDIVTKSLNGIETSPFMADITNALKSLEAIDFDLYLNAVTDLDKKHSENIMKRIKTRITNMRASLNSKN